MRIELISLAGILISLALLILMTYRGVSVLVIAPVCSVIVILSAGMPLMDTLMDGYMTSYADFVKNYFFIFFCSAILGKMMSDSGAARGIGVAIAGLAQRATGHEKLLALLAVVLINALLSLGGVGSYVIVFTMMTICKSLFEKLDMPWHMYTCSSFGSGVLTLGMMPGSPSAVNIIPTTYLGTTVRAAPVLGFIGSGITLLLGIAYFQYIIAKAEREHEGFLPTGRRIKEAYQEDDRSDPPPFWKSILPTAVLLVVMNVLGWPPVVSMVAAMAATYVLFFRELHDMKQTVKEGANNGVAALASICAVVGFGGAVAATPGYAMVIRSMDRLPGPPMVQLLVSVTILVAITGSPSGGLGIAMDQLADRFLAMGLDPQVIHRLSAMAATGFDNLPHNGSINNTLTVVHLTHKEAYKHYWWSNTVIPVIGTVLTAVIAQSGVV